MNLILILESLKLQITQMATTTTTFVFGISIQKMASQMDKYIHQKYNIYDVDPTVLIHFLPQMGKRDHPSLQKWHQVYKRGMEVVLVPIPYHLIPVL